MYKRPDIRIWTATQVGCLLDKSVQQVNSLAIKGLLVPVYGIKHGRLHYSSRAIQNFHSGVVFPPELPVTPRYSWDFLQKGEAARLMNIGPHLLSQWDNKGVLLRHSVTNSGRRMYNFEKLKSLVFNESMEKQ